MGNAAGIAFLRDHRRQPFGKAEPPLRLRQRHDPAIRAEASASNAAVTFCALPLETRTATNYRRWWRARRAPICSKDRLQQPVPTPDQKLTLLPPTHIRPAL